MSLKKTFCPSPWFHMRITNSGTYEPCRWMSKDDSSRVDFNNSIQTVAPLTYFQKNMSGLRTALLEGDAPDMCDDCYTMDQYHKPSGRLRQLLKIGVQEQYFEKSLAGSTLKLDFDYSNQNQGHTNRHVSDWQIDLGNYCNGACVFCNPESSSRLAAEFQRLGLVEQVPPPAWCDDPELIDQFVQTLTSSTNLQYLHFIGGETLITPGFKKILTALVDAGLAQDITIGFTTNLTVWSDDIVELLKKFGQINLGMSVETLTPINDYVRYPSRRSQTQELLDRWVELGRQQNWLMQLRITPTCLTVHELHTVYDYAWQNNIAVESCNFLTDPKFFRISVLPQEYRINTISTIEQWIHDHQTVGAEQIINTRDPNITQHQIVQDAESYLNYLKSAPDESSRLPDLVAYLKRLESSRDNSILTYLPQYEDLFRSAGY
jgi:sulfatase maturation enzyme AslB (radical SAM superfamily)